MTVIAIKAPVITRSRSPPTLIFPGSTFVAPPKTLLGTWQLTNKISGTQYHHRLIFYSSCHVPRRDLGGATKVKPGTIRVGGEQLLMITGALFATTALKLDW